MSLTEFFIVDSTLREGEQFVGAAFSSKDKIEIARTLSEFGAEYLEVTSPCASPQSRRDCEHLASLGLRSKVVTHIRCHPDDAEIALDVGVDGINVVIGTSDLLRQFAHGKDINQVIDLAAQVLTYIRQQSPTIELRFSTEDSFRSSLEDLLQVYTAIERLGVVNRFGIADTVGIATPQQVTNLVRTLRPLTQADIEFHGHNDTGCAIANSYSALEAGATHINTCILGIGERNGITPLSGLIARLYTLNPDLVRRKYQLPLLKHLDQLVAQKVGVTIPFNHYITGKSAFSHKAGIHLKALLKNSKTYEILDPQDFDLTRRLEVAHRLTGWHAIQERADQLGLDLPETQLRAATQYIKALADHRQLSLADVDVILHQWRNNSMLQKVAESQESFG
jgi:homocitrate synthase